MKSARERAIEIAWDFSNKQFSLELFRRMLEDQSPAGEAARQLVAAIERGVERDRADVLHALGPS